MWKRFWNIDSQFPTEIKLESGIKLAARTTDLAAGDGDLLDVLFKNMTGDTFHGWFGSLGGESEIRIHRLIVILIGELDVSVCGEAERSRPRGWSSVSLQG